MSLTKAWVIADYIAMDIRKKVKLSKVYAGMAIASGSALAASVVYAPLRPFSRVFQWAALGLSGAAVMQNSKEQAELEKKVKDLVFENAREVFSSAIPNKTPEQLTDRDTLQLALLEDHDRENLSMPLQVEALKAQVLLGMIKAMNTGQGVPVRPDFANRTAAELCCPNGIEGLCEERAKYSGASNDNEEPKGTTDLMIAGGAEAAETVAGSYIKKKGLGSIFSFTEVAGVFSASGKILLASSKELETLEDFLDYEMESYSDAKSKFVTDALPAPAPLRLPPPGQTPDT